MDRYRRIEKPKVVTPIEENEIRITSQGRMGNYITYAMNLLQDKGSNKIVFKAMGRAINKTVTIVELIKRRIVGIHQVTKIFSIDITDNWEPLEEGLNPVETTRHVSMITITLSKEELDTSSNGYQAPVLADHVPTAPEYDNDREEMRSSGFRGRGRGGRGRSGRSRGGGYGENGFIPVATEQEDGGWDRNRGGSARGGYRGRGRGGSYNNDSYHQQGGGGYNEESTFHGPGRGGYNEEPAFHGAGRGGYNNNNRQFDNHGERGGRGGYNGGQFENQEPNVHGRGRGRGYRGRGRGSGGFRANGVWGRGGGGFRANGVR